VLQAVLTTPSSANRYFECITNLSIRVSASINAFRPSSTRNTKFAWRLSYLDMHQSLVPRNCSKVGYRRYLKPPAGRCNLTPAAVGEDATTWHAPTKPNARGAALSRFPQLCFRIRLSEISRENWLPVCATSNLLTFSYFSISDMA
jgi:hypothetical protein